MKAIFFILIFQISSACFAWGVRGHESICEAAAQIVKNQELAKFLNQKRAKIGYLCDVPDLQWRVMSQNYKEHRLNPENLGYSLQDLPLDYKNILKLHPGDTKLLGSNWWRAEQFYRRASRIKFQPNAQKATTNPAQEFLLNLGFMGHFIGDISQPLHSIADYDGYAAGHGGIHFYYEESVVHYIPGNLPEKIVARANEKLRNDSPSTLQFLSEKSVLLKVRALAILAHPDEETIFALDPISKVSSFERGMSIPAGRASPAIAVTAYEPVIVNEMANAALLLAQLWDQAYETVGKPNLTQTTPFRIPTVIGFVAPDYF